MVDLAQLRDARPADLYPAQSAFDTLSAAFEQHVDAIRSYTALPEWLGFAGTTARNQLVGTNQKLYAAHDELQGIGTVLREAGDAFLVAQSELDAALKDAQAAQFTVAADGSVSYPPPAPASSTAISASGPPSAASRWAPVTANQSANQELATDLANRIAAAVAQANEADQKVAALLNTLAQQARNGTGLAISTAMASLSQAQELGTTLLAADMPGANATAAQINQWWNELSPLTQQHLIKDYPGVIGNRNGIPALARNQANRIYLPQLITQFEQMPQPLDAADEQKLQGFKKIQAKLDHYSPGAVPPLLLLGIGDQGQGRGILAFGNPDTSTNVCAFVPGMSSTLSSLAGGDSNDALNLWSAAHAVSPGSSNCTITWLGYDAPPGVGTDPHALAVMGDWRGQAGGASYDQFLSGIRATHAGSSLHLTALGHSYGSYTVGQAAMRPGGTGADDLILIGSPGTGASNASQLNMLPGHVWDGAAQNDEVTHLPSKTSVETGIDLGPVLGPIGGAVVHYTDPSELWFGQDPASKAFGAKRFAVANGPVWPLLQAHLDYFDPKSKSLNNMAEIMTGNPQSVTPQAQR